MALIFDGKQFAQDKETQLIKRLQSLSLSRQLQVCTFLFTEDEGSVLYTRLKQTAASRIGINYEPRICSFLSDRKELIEAITTVSNDHTITGVMIQKPAKETWMSMHPQATNEDFSLWWKQLTQAIDPTKDVDCLTQENLEMIEVGTWKKETGGRGILPATVQACLDIIEFATIKLTWEKSQLYEKKVLVVGRSDIVGKPLATVLKSTFPRVTLVGRQEFEKCNLSEFDVVVSAVGVPDLITTVKPGAIVIDVGAPQGDVQRAMVEPMAAFLTPVPGGVGPVTVVSLMENILTLLDL